MKLKHIQTQEMSALKVGIDLKTARKYLRLGKLPSELVEPRHWRTRSDPFKEVWPTLERMLENAPGLEAKTLLEWLVEQAHEEGDSAFHFGQLRTLQRRIRAWRAEKGPDKEVIFPQKILPGKQSQSDYTNMNGLRIHIHGEFFPHLLFHFMLPYSRWETVSVCCSESFESLVSGYTAAVWELGAVAPEHRTDNLSAATHHFKNMREFNESWKYFLAYHGVKPSRNNPGESHENGSVEKSHDLLKRTVNQQLLLRGSRDFISLEAYETFLKQVLLRRNKGRETRLVQDLEHFLPLPPRRWQAVRTLSVTVGPFSTISVLKGIYSVPSRLIGYGLEVDLYAKHLDIRYGRKILETLPRLPKDQGIAVNYRHIISYLLRKPGAFEHYQYKESLFPRLVFRKAYDVLKNHSPMTGHKLYLKILHMAAIGNETEVASALEIFFEAGEVPLPELVKELLDLPLAGPPPVFINPPTLAHYDMLLGTFASSREEISHATH